MSHLIGPCADLGWTALKATLMFLVAVVGLRLSQRRMLAELNVFDLVVTVAVGAIVGRTATSATTSFATGAVALITLLVAHRIVAVMHRRGWLGRAARPTPAGAAHPRPAAGTRSAVSRAHAARCLSAASTSRWKVIWTPLITCCGEERGGMTIVRCGQAQGQAIRAGLQEAGTDRDHL